MLYEVITKNNEIRQVGEIPESWLGVPLIVDNEPIGAIVVQNYERPETYTRQSVEVFEIVAHELSIYIQQSRAKEQLILAKEKAEESDRLKSAFLANMSHEIRTPMNAIVGFSELLCDMEPTPDEQRSYAEIIRARSNDLLTIINDILDISKLEAGQVSVSRQNTNIELLLEQIYAGFRLICRITSYNVCYTKLLRWLNRTFYHYL